jgi:hypothetical protein
MEYTLRIEGMYLIIQTAVKEEHAVIGILYGGGIKLHHRRIHDPAQIWNMKNIAHI